MSGAQRSPGTRARDGQKAQDKKKKEKNSVPRGARHQPLPRSTRSAVLVKPGVGQTYAEVLQKLKSNVNLTETKVEDRAVQKTRDGALLIRLGKGAENRQDFKTAVARAIGEIGQIRDLTQKVTLEVLDLDCTVTEADVREAITREVPDIPDVKIHVLKPNKFEQQMALCEVDAREATAWLKIGKLRIGWVRCRIRQRLIVQRCHRCHESDLRTEGSDLTNACWKCGTSGHKAKDSTSRPKCFLCARQQGRDAKHTPES